MSDTIPSLTHFAPIQCPYCWQAIELIIDVAFAEQQMVEDCPNCCRPLALQVFMDSVGDINVQLDNDDF